MTRAEQNNYHKQRAVELGLPIGTGKRYSRQDIISFVDASPDLGNPTTTTQPTETDPFLLLGGVLKDKRGPLSKTYIAKQVGVTDGFIGLVESGHRKPSKHVLTQWGRVLGMNEQEMSLAYDMAGYEIPDIENFANKLSLEDRTMINELQGVLGNPNLTRQQKESAHIQLRNFTNFLRYQFGASENKPQDSDIK